MGVVYTGLVFVLPKTTSSNGGRLQSGLPRNAQIASMELPLRLSLIQMLSASERLWQPHPADWLKEHDNMADDKTKVGGQDRKRINLSEDYEVRDWCNSLGVNEEQLRMAVAAVGDEADEVRAHLGKK